MKKEDLTTRLFRNLFHIQGPFDECRQEIIYKACARSMVQIVYSSFFLFLFYLLFGRFIEMVRYAMPYIFFGLIYFITLKTQRTVKDLHFEKDDKSEMMYRTYSKQEIRLRSWLVFFGILIGLFTLLCFHKLYVKQIPLSIFLEKLFQTDILIPLLVFGLSIAAIFGTMVNAFLSLKEDKTPKNRNPKEKINQ